MSLKILYTAQATAVGGRNGHTETPDKLVSADLSVPKEMGGPGKPNTTTPEHLFAAGYAACFGSAIDYVAKVQKKQIGLVTVTAEVGIGSRDTGGFGLAVTLRPRIEGASAEDTKALIAEADKVCPYSQAIRNNVEVKLEVG
jgi:Ohr subfamily peroxiredoxin